MENMNLLDLDNDVFNIIGDYVKKDNIERDFQEYCRNLTEKMKQDIFDYVDIQMKLERKDAK
jgi:hypothetical protein